MMFSFLVLTVLTLSQGGAASDSTSPSVAHLTEGHYQLSVTIEDTTRGRGVQGIGVTIKLRRGFLFLGRKKKDIDLKTDKSGQVVVHGLPSGNVELLLHVEKDRPQKYKADLRPGPKKSVQLHAGRLSMLLEWQLR